MSQSIQQLAKRSSVPITVPKRNVYITNQRRHTLPALSYDFLTKSTLTSVSMSLLINSMNAFFQTIQTMEDEIMLPSRLKDMSVEDLVLDSAVQPDNWHEIYTFIRDIRDQLQRTHPFADDGNDNDSSEKQSEYANDDDDNNDDLREKQRKYSTDDEGIMISNDDHNQYSSASSTVSSGEFEQSLTSSTGASLDAIKNELKYHYYSLFRSFENLTSMSNRVTEKYRSESTF